MVIFLRIDISRKNEAQKLGDFSKVADQTLGRDFIYLTKRYSKHRMILLPLSSL